MDVKISDTEFTLSRHSVFLDSDVIRQNTTASLKNESVIIR